MRHGTRNGHLKTGWFTDYGRHADRVSTLWWTALNKLKHTRLGLDIKIQISTRSLLALSSINCVSVFFSLQKVVGSEEIQQKAHFTIPVDESPLGEHALLDVPCPLQSNIRCHVISIQSFYHGGKAPLLPSKIYDETAFPVRAEQRTITFTRIKSDGVSCKQDQNWDVQRRTSVNSYKNFVTRPATALHTQKKKVSDTVKIDLGRARGIALRCDEKSKRRKDQHLYQQLFSDFFKLFLFLEKRVLSCCSKNSWWSKETTITYNPKTQYNII